MKRACIFIIVLMIVPWALHPEMRKADRIGVTLNGINGLFGEVQLDYSMKYGSFEFSVKPGVRIFYPQESGAWIQGWGFSLRPSFHRYLTRSIYFGLVIPVVWWLDPPDPIHDIDFVLRTGVAPMLGWKHALGILLLSAELGFGVGAQQVWLENPWAYGATGWFALHGQLGVGLAFVRKGESRE